MSAPATTIPDARTRYTEPEELDRSAFLLLSSVLVLLGMGVVMVYSAAAVEAAESGRGDGSPQRPLLSHLFKVGVGITLMLVTARLDLRRLLGLAKPFYAVALLLLALVLVPGIGVLSHGSQRWLATQSFLGFGLQPSEFAKLALVVALAAWYARVGDVGASFTRTFLPAAAAILLPGALILLETDFGTFLLVTTLGFLLLLVAGAKVHQLLLLALLSLPPALLFLWLNPGTRYVFARIGAFLGHSGEGASIAAGAAQQIDFAQSALQVGGLSGVGLGAGRHKLFFLAESENDFILSVIGEELGLIGTSTVLLLLALLLWSGRRVLLGVRHRFGFLLVVGVLVTIAMQALINVFVAVRWAPVKGIPLPFVSSGGSSLTALCLGVGLIHAAVRQADRADGELGPEGVNA